MGRPVEIFQDGFKNWKEMKTSSKITAILDIALPAAWFVAYSGGGAFLLARQATSNPDHVSPYIPFVIFLWIAGFFIGHQIIETCYLFLIKLHDSKLHAFQNASVLDIDNLRVAGSDSCNNLPSELINYASKSNYNVKKDTSKIVRFLKPKGSIYKVPLHC